MTTKAVPQHQLFVRWSVSEIARRTGYREAYLLRLRDGHLPLPKSFRHKISAIFRKPESELFLEETP